MNARDSNDRTNETASPPGADGVRHGFETSWGALWRDGSARFRLWAPQAGGLTLRLAGRDLAMEKQDAGWFALTAEAEPGQEYAFVLPDGMVVPDPAARAQAGDVHGPSRIVDPAPTPGDMTGVDALGKKR